MTPADRSSLLTKLEAGRTALLSSVQGLSDCEASTKPPDGGWSAIQNIEHLAKVERNLMRNIRSSSRIEGEPAPGREEMLYARVQQRDKKIQAPPAAQPEGDCANIADALARFDAARADTLAFIESCDYDLRLRSTTHPLLGPVTVCECLHPIAAHPIRHAAQIRELRA